MSSAVGFLAIAFVLSILGGAALVYFTNRGRRLPDVSQKRSDDRPNRWGQRSLTVIRSAVCECSVSIPMNRSGVSRCPAT